jgi:hypothetical protein
MPCSLRDRRVTGSHSNAAAIRAATNAELKTEMAQPTEPRPPRSARLKLSILLAIVVASLSAAVWALDRYELVVSIEPVVPVALRDSVPVRMRLDQSVDVELPDPLHATVRLGKLSIPLNETIVVPLATTLSVPIDAEVQIDQPLRIALTVPIRTVLTERELNLSRLVVPVDDDVFVDDTLDLDVIIPLDTEVTTTLGIVVPVKGQLPIRARVPIHQKLHIRSRLTVGIEKFAIPLSVDLPIEATLPFKQTIRVRGIIDVPIHQRLAIPIRQVLHPDVQEPIAVTAAVNGKIHAALKADIATDVKVREVLQTQLGAVHVQVGDLSVVERSAR